MEFVLLEIMKHKLFFILYFAISPFSAVWQVMIQKTIPFKCKNINTCILQCTLVPEVFLIFHRISRSCERAAKWLEQESRSGEKEKPLVTLDLNLTSCRRTGQDLTLELGLVDFYKHGNKFDWSV